MLSSLSPQILPKSDQQHPSPQTFQEEAVRAQDSKDQKLASVIWKQTKPSNPVLTGTETLCLLTGNMHQIGYKLCSELSFSWSGLKLAIPLSGFS